jgi:hypothetical protein
MSESYTTALNSPWREKARIVGEIFPVLQNNATINEMNIIKELVEINKVLSYEKDNITIRFVSDNVRHQVMSYFVLNCLNTDQDYENYIRLSSVDSLLEYVCPWSWPRIKKERCLYLPEKLEKAFLNKVGFAAVNHPDWRYSLRDYLKNCELLFCFKFTDYYFCTYLYLCHVAYTHECRWFQQQYNRSL